MKELTKKKGIILTSKDYKENARLLTILTEDGLENAILRGANKINSKNKKFTIIPVEVEYVRTISTLATFTEGYITYNFINLKLDQNKSLIYLAIVEKILAFTDSIDDKSQMYEFVNKILTLLDQTKYPIVVLYLFEIKLLYLIGIAPILNSCVICHTSSDDCGFSLSLGGIICNSCMIKYPIDYDANTTKVFKYLYFIKLDKVDEKFLELIDQTKLSFTKLIDSYYEKYIDFSSKVKKVIRSVN